MCSNSTKQRIAAALRSLMNERPFDRITVQNLMDAAGMKRQSFYYHFHDTRDVLLWIFRQELAQPLERSGLEFVPWVCQALQIVELDRVFYRKLLSAVHPEFIRETSVGVLCKRVAQLLYGSAPESRLSDAEGYVVDFFVQAFVDHFLRFLAGREPLDLPQVQEQIQALLAVIGK